jgi:hypothetical protein
VRPTIRCLAEDLRRPLPPLDESLEDVDHELLDEVRRLAPESPTGQKRILSIDYPLVFRIRLGRLRGATWIDDVHEIVWLLAAETREEGSRDDAYEYFESLHRSGKLLPTQEDRLRDRAETAARFFSSLRHEAPTLVEAAREKAGSEIRATLGRAVEVVLLIAKSDDLEEVWLAVDYRVPDRIRNAVFVEFERLFGDAEWEWRADWPKRTLQWFEIARMALRAATS